MAVDPRSLSIRLRKQWSPARLSWKWAGDRIEDSDWLRRCGAPRYFPDADYDAVLGAVGAYGFDLAVPLD